MKINSVMGLTLSLKLSGRQEGNNWETIGMVGAKHGKS